MAARNVTIPFFLDFTPKSQARPRVVRYQNPLGHEGILGNGFHP